MAFLLPLYSYNYLWQRDSLKAFGGNRPEILNYAELMANELRANALPAFLLLIPSPPSYAL